MKYLIMTRDEWDRSLAEEMIEAGVHVAAEGLTGPELARGDVASPAVTGFYLIDCGAGEAGAWAARSGDCELRPVLEDGGQEF